MSRLSPSNPLGGVVLSVASACIYGLLWLLRPLLVPLLFWLAVGGLLLWVIFVPIAGDTEFPTWPVLAMSASCLLGAFAYTIALEWLRAGQR
jgi:hypothetical protein